MTGFAAGARVTALVALMSSLAGAAIAQPAPDPVGPYALDARVTLPGYKADAAIASGIGVDTTAMPTRGLGLVFGAHVYPLHKGVVSLGLGGELLLSGRSRTPASDSTTTVTPETVETRFSTFGPQVSLNFGTRQGWSYLSGGIGWSKYTTELTSAPLPDGSSASTINYGGGARWFAKEHLALSLDLRFYSVGAQEASVGRPAFPKVKMVAFSAGISLK